MRNYRKDFGKLGMGCFGIGGPFKGENGYYAYGEVEDDISIKTVHKAIDMGIKLFDTADVYGSGRSELVLGMAIKGYRDDVIIATKFGSVFEEGVTDGSGPTGKNTSEEYIRSAVLDSMRRLQTDFIDIYQLHSSQHDHKDAQRIQMILEELVQEGLIGTYGWSTDDPTRIAIFTQSRHCISVQYALTLRHRNPAMIALCEEKGLWGLIRSPFGSGTMTKKYDKETKLPPNHMLASVDFSSEKNQVIRRKLVEFDRIVGEDGRSRVQGILGYLMAKSDTIIPIPGAKTVRQIEENAKTIEFNSMSSDMVKQIDNLFDDVSQLTFSGIAKSEEE